jgi:RimJ/RimL family protein N-acetyltransferase
MSILNLEPLTLDEIRAVIAAMPPTERAHVSAAWLADLQAATAADPWQHGFAVVLRDGGASAGTAGFKGPPSADGMVEIAYGIAAEHQGRGYATEAARALLDYAARSGCVRLVRAHTLPEPNASTRVLAKCGFVRLGAVEDPEDGTVWRWERMLDAAGGPAAG